MVNSINTNSTNTQQDYTRRECFAYRPETANDPEHCASLNELYCKDEKKCSFFTHKNDFDVAAMKTAIKEYAKTHPDSSAENQVPMSALEKLMSEGEGS